MSADGHVIFDTALDNSQLEKDLDKATKKIEKLEGSIRKTESSRAPVVEQLKAAKEEAVSTYNSVERLKKALADSQAATSVESGLGVSDPDRYIAELENQQQIRAELKEQEKILKQKESAAEQLEKRDAAYVEKLKEQTAELRRQKEAAGAIAEQVQKAQAAAPVSNMMKGVEKRIDKLGKRMLGLAKRVFVFTLITSALRGMRTWLGNVIRTNDEATNAMARLKGALLTLAQPLVNVLIPAFITLVNILTRIVTAAASLISLIFGKSISQSKEAAKALNAETSALEGVGSAAEDAGGSLAGFDEINQLAGESAGAGSSGSGTIAPDFSFDTGTAEGDFEKLLNWIKLIGAALLYWKLPKSLRGGLKTLIGLLMALDGAIEFVRSAWDAWQNGVTTENALSMIARAAELALGLFLALGPKFGPIAAGISLIVTGITMLATGFHDAFENGWNFQNLLLSIAGILAAGIGIGLLTKSWIPLLIAGIAAILLALTVATGHGEELLEGVRMVCQGFLDFITGVFGGDIEEALSGISMMFEGLHLAVNAVIGGVRDTILSFLDWLDEKTGGKFHSIIETAKGIVTAFFDTLEETFSGVIDGIQQLLSGLIKFLTGVFTNDWDMAWEGIKDIFRGICNQISSVFEGAINLIIRAINWLISQANKLQFKMPEIFGGKTYGINIQPIKEFRIPRLAAGAVIPPNREFMAVLGDQTRGNNIETPESLLRQIFREESGSAEMLAVLQAILEAVKSGKVMTVDKRVLARIAAEGINDMTLAAGKPVLLI